MRDGGNLHGVGGIEEGKGAVAGSLVRTEQYHFFATIYNYFASVFISKSFVLIFLVVC